MTFSWRGASRDIMRVLWAALGGARAAYAGSTARERFWRTPISIETEQNRHPRRRLPKKQKKNHDRRRGVLDSVGGKKKKYSLRDSNPRPKTSALNWRLRPLGQNCEVIGRALVVKPDPRMMARSQTTNHFWSV